MPIWLKIGTQKIVFAGHEAISDSKKSKKFKESEVKIMTLSEIQPSQRLPQPIEDLASKACIEGMSQRRSGGQSDGTDDKFRVTLQCRQALLGFFADGDEPPTSTQLPGILIVYGVHCRLSNIDEHRRWNEDEVFEVAGVEVIRKQGEKIPGSLMAGWTELREKHPEYFEELVVMQQPAATCDEIIVGWSLEDLGKRFSGVVLQRDLVSGALSSRAKLAAYLQQIIPCWVGPGMTPVVQVTDTDVAFPLKKIIERRKWDITKEFKELAIKEGRETSFKMGPPELMKVLYGSVMEFKEWADAQHLVLRALRRNGQLAYIPKNGKLEVITEELCPWMVKLKVGDIGGHRYPDSWVEDRYLWTTDGVPWKPDWSECLTKADKADQAADELGEKKNGKSEEDAYQEFIMRKLGKLSHSNSDHEFAVVHEMVCCGVLVKVPIFEMEIDEQTNLINPKLLEILKLTPTERRAKAAISGNLQKGEKKRFLQRTFKSVGSGSRLKLALKPFSEDLMKQLDEELMTKTRREVFQNLKFSAGGKKSKKDVKVVEKIDKIKKKKGFMAKVAKNLVAKIKGKVNDKEKDK